MRTSRIFRTGSLVAAAMLPLMLGADAAPTAPQNTPSTRPSHLFGGGGGGGFGGRRGDQRGEQGPEGHRLDMPSQEEISAAITFFNDNSPNRMKYFNQLPEGSPAHRMAANAMARAFRPIQNFKDTSPKLHELLVSQVKLRDEAFQLAKDGDDGKLRDKTTEIVTNSLQARTLRLEVLQKELTEQQTQLATDQSNPSGLVDPEMDRIKEDEKNIVDRAGRFHDRPSMLDVDPAADPLAAVAPVDLPTH